MGLDVWAVSWDQASPTSCKTCQGRGVLTWDHFVAMYPQCEGIAPILQRTLIDKGALNCIDCSGRGMRVYHPPLEDHLFTSLPAYRSAELAYAERWFRFASDLGWQYTVVDNMYLDPLSVATLDQLLHTRHDTAKHPNDTTFIADQFNAFHTWWHRVLSVHGGLALSR